jgi:hypothetical protein
MRLWNWFLALFARKKRLVSSSTFSELDAMLLSTYKIERQKVEEEEKLRLAKRKAEEEERDIASKLDAEEGLKHITPENYRLAWKCLAKMAVSYPDSTISIVEHDAGITHPKAWTPFAKRFIELCSERGIKTEAIKWNQFSISIHAKSFLEYIKRIEAASASGSDNKTIKTSAYR